MLSADRSAAGVTRLGRLRSKIDKVNRQISKRGSYVSLFRSRSFDSDKDTTMPRAVSFQHANSFDSDVSMPGNLRKDSFDISTQPAPGLRPILKHPLSASAKGRPKPQLISDPTHMPYTPTILQNLTVDPIQDDSQNYSESVSYSDSEIPGRVAASSFSAPVASSKAAGGQRARYSVYHGPTNIKRTFRMRPYHCFPKPLLMTEEDIYADSLKPSQIVEHCKSYLAPTQSEAIAKNIAVPKHIQQLYGTPKKDGRIGAIRVEVLGCISLARTKPDVGVYLVCGDAAFFTDVLTGYRSPMWPCASRRAATFPIHHAYAQLFVGVFDMRVRKNKENDVFCGRVAIDISSLRPDTEYDVTLPLRVSTFVYDRRKRGVIRLRFSLYWFSERSAVVSYFKSAKSITKSSLFVEGYPTIPCADPKTFRNVAVTVYGQDLPGKYSRNAFRATMREFNLYQQNLRLTLQHLALDAILYERVYISLYLYMAGMYCVWTSSISMLPPFCGGYILILFSENYRFYVKDSKYNLGYQPVTLLEVASGLVSRPTDSRYTSSNRNNSNAVVKSFGPIAIHKKAKRRKGQAARSSGTEHVDGGASDNSDDEIQLLDHREFPFSERQAYPKTSVEHALAPSLSNKRGTS
jgi:hypothetical protein